MDRYFIFTTDCHLNSIQYIRDSLRNEFEDAISDSVYDIIPTLVVIAVTCINIAGVDWLVRFETLLGVRTCSHTVRILIRSTNFADV